MDAALSQGSLEDTAMGRSLCCSQLTGQLCTVLTVLLFLCHAQGIQSPVNTTSGEVTGKSVTFRGKNLWEFKMVPYAEPPVGNLRFRPPQPKTREASPIDGSKEEYKICPQKAIAVPELQKTLEGLVNQTWTLDEDCLYLDIYVPQSASTTNLLPVMFWIHGGGYVTGWGRLSSGRVLASDFDIVVVTINYRLGALGFLNTGDNNAVGDFGLRDQILALQWVNDNIRNFGGNPEKITIAGESAGGGSVAQLTVAPSSEGLFQQAIIQSGGLDNPWARAVNPKSLAIVLAQMMSCSTASMTELVDCLRTKTPEEIAKIQTAAFLQFAPACSGGVLPFTLSQLEKSQAKRLAKLNILMGTNAQEGAMYFELMSFNQIDTEGGASDVYAENFTTNELLSTGTPPAHIPSLKPVVKFLYTDWMMPNNAITRSKKMVDLSGDLWIIAGAVKYIRLHAKVGLPAEDKGQAFFYLLKHRPSWMAKKAWRYGADHGDDLFFVFGNPLEYPSLNATAEEKVLSQTIMTYWTNFIKTGNPNTPLTTVNNNPLTTWPQFELNNQKYLKLDITMDSDSVDHRLFAKRMFFWTEYYPTELKRLQSLKPPPPCKTTSGCPVTMVTQTTILTVIISVIAMFWSQNRY